MHKIIYLKVLKEQTITDGSKIVFPILKRAFMIYSYINVYNYFNNLD